MKSIMSKIASVVFMLALVVGALGVTVTPALADGTLTCGTPVINYNDGLRWGDPDYEEYNCVQWGTNGIKLHWIDQGWTTSYGWGSREYDFWFSDDRGSGNQTYYYYIVSRSTGQFNYCGPHVGVVYSDFSLAFTTGACNLATGNGFATYTGSVRTGYRFFYTNYASHDLVDEIDVDMYVFPDPIAHPYPWEVNMHFWKDTAEDQNGNSLMWIGATYDYLDEVNRVLAKNTNIQLYWDGQFAIANTLTDAFTIMLGALCPGYWDAHPNDINVWFSTSNGGRDLGLPGWNLGRDCLGYGSIIINTYSIANETHHWTAPTRADATVAYNNGDGSTGSDYQIYWTYVNSFVHELVHNYGAYSGTEAYYYKTVTDDNYASNYPNAYIQLNNDYTADSWWNGEYAHPYDHPDLAHSPMASWVLNYYYWSCDTNCIRGFEDMRAAITLDRLSVDYITHPEYRVQSHYDPLNYPERVKAENLLVPNLHELLVTQLDGNGQPKFGLTIKAWYMGTNMGEGGGSGEVLIEDNLVTNIDGQVSIPINSDMVVPDENAITHTFTYHSTVLLKSYDSAGNQYGDPQIVDGYNIQLAAFDFLPNALTSYSVMMTKKPDTGYVLPSINANGGNASGWVLENGVGSGVGGSNSTAGSLVIGDATNKSGYRSFVQFDTSSVPDNAIIDYFTVHFYSNAAVGDVSGFGPAGNPNAFTLQIKDPCFGNCYLENSDWEASASYSPVAYIDYSGSGRWYHSGQISVSTITNFINKTGLTEFRLRFNYATNGDTIADQAKFYNAAGTYPPYINIAYHIP